MPRSNRLSLSLKFTHQNPLYISLLPQTFHTPNQPPTLCCDRPTYMEHGRLQTVRLLTLSCFHSQQISRQ